ncbi:MAG: hypothetical protein M3362_17355 [Acidobacteriota bacterium]|nr:hypothetical protein [Acidobacteriota bacterium]
MIATVMTLCCGRAIFHADDCYTQRLVHDAKTGQYIGVLRGECRAYERKLDKEIVTYRVERSDGITIDLPSDKVTVMEQ